MVCLPSVFAADGKNEFELKLGAFICSDACELRDRARHGDHEG